MREQYLTARNLFRFLAVGVGKPTVCIPFLSKHLDVTQSGFWWCFLSAGIPESALLPYFEPRRQPPRALSNLMNRTVPHSMPVRLYHAMEEHLTPENLLHMTAWMATALDKDMNPLSIHQALNAMEDEIFQAGTDIEFAELYSFFASLRPGELDAGIVDQNRLFLQAAFRFSMLGLHAIYGDRMLDSEALIRLRTCRFCDPGILWTAVSSIVPRANQYGFRPVAAAVKKDGDVKEDSQAGELEVGDPVTYLRLFGEEALPPAEIRARYHDAGTGWYVVANWLDVDIVVNDAPKASYEGSTSLGTIANGTLIYVLSAQGYRGLHASSGVWGRVWWGGEIAWVPMNTLVHISRAAAAEATCDSDPSAHEEKGQENPQG